jgi:hypothetical protein
MSLGFPHPILPLLPAGSTLTLIGLGLLCEAVRLAVAVSALRAQGRNLPLTWVFLPHLVQPLACLAACKALCDIVRRPFYWDKTQHGLCSAAVT